MSESQERRVAPYDLSKDLKEALKSPALWAAIVASWIAVGAAGYLVAKLLD